MKRCLPILCLIFLLLTIGLTKNYLTPYKSPSAFTYFVKPSPYLEHFTFGYREFVSDMLWLRTIQDVDQCDKVLKEKNESCAYSWVYRMVDKITDLSPRFRIIYATVPLLLAVVINDVPGSVLLLDKGLRYFPNDWPILYRGGYLYLFEQGNKVKAAEYFTRAQKNGGPDWLVSYATRLYSEAGRVELAKQLLNEYEQTGLAPALLDRMRARLLEASQK